MPKFFERLGNLLNTNNQESFLLAGLGNPGKEYAETRHNMGFMVADEIARLLGENFSRVEQNALVCKAQYEGRRLILAKPRTFMNLSGQAVGGLVRFYKVPLANVLVIYDEVDLPFETIRLRAEGGSAGHNGIKSIIQHLGTQDFPRMRMGVGRPPGKMKTPDHVLQDFSRQQQEDLPFFIRRGADAAFKFVTEGIIAAMNEYNGKDE